MTKQEEIREGIDEILVLFGRAKKSLLDAEDRAYLKVDIFDYLSSQGCVIRVDRELPSIKEVFPLGGVPKEFTKGLEYYRCFLMGTDYVAVEPII